MEQDIEKLIKERAKLVPLPVQEVLISGTIEQVTKKMIDEFHLHLDIADTISNEVLLSLLGITEPKDLPEHIKKEAGLDEATTSKIVKFLNAELYAPLVTKLREGVKKETSVIAQNTPQSTSDTSTKKDTPTVPVQEKTVPEIKKETIEEKTEIQAPPSPVVKEYVRDPYREPIDEKEL